MNQSNLFAGALPLVCLTLFFASIGSSHAEPLKGEEIRDLLVGKRIYLATPFGGEFPLRYNPDGRVAGDGTAVGLGRIAAPRETGRWWIEGDRMCQQWQTWYDGRRFCFTLETSGPGKIKWARHDGKTGIARISG